LRRHLDRHGAHLATGGNHGAVGSHSPIDISHCANLEATAARPACEAMAHGGAAEAPATFDDNLMGAHTTEDPCMMVAAGPDRTACYATQRP